MKTIKNIKVLQGHEGAVYKIVFDATDQKLYSAGGDGWLVEWDVRQGDHGVLIARVPDQIFSMTVTREYFLLGSFQGNFYIIRRSDKTILHQEKIHQGGIFDVYYGDGFFYTFGGDGKIVQWDEKDFRKTQILPLSAKSLRTFALSPERKEIAVACSDSSIYILSYPELYLQRQIEAAHDPSVFSLLYDGKWLVSGGRDAKLRIWSPARNYRLLETIDAHWYAIYDILRIPGYFVTASRDKSIRWWEDSTFLPVTTVKWGEVDQAHVHSVNTLAYDPKTNIVFSGSDDRTIRLWEMNG